MAFITQLKKPFEEYVWVTCSNHCKQTEGPKGNWLNQNGCLDGWMEHPKSSMICRKLKCVFLFWGEGPKACNTQSGQIGKMKQCLLQGHLQYYMLIKQPICIYLLGQWLNFKLFGITYLVGKISTNFFFRVHWLSEFRCILYIYIKVKCLNTCIYINIYIYICICKYIDIQLGNIFSFADGWCSSRTLRISSTEICRAVVKIAIFCWHQQPVYEIPRWNPIISWVKGQLGIPLTV